MYKNILKTTFRHLWRDKLYSIINLTGLAIGLGCTILMTTVVLHDLSYDSFHKNKNFIYRVIYGNFCKMPYTLGSTMKENYPEIKEVFRILHGYNYSIKKDNEYIKEKKFYFADNSIVDIFSFQIISGKSDRFLPMTNSVAISKKMAEKYFPQKNPIGSELTVNIETELVNFTVSAVFADFPSNSTITPDFIANIESSFSQISKQWVTFGNVQEKKDLRTTWDDMSFETFILVKDNSDINSLISKLGNFSGKFDKDHKDKKIHFQRLKDIYFHSSGFQWNHMTKSGEIQIVRIYIGIAILILVIAIINYILLSIAQSDRRIKEIALRKTFGSSRSKLVLRFIAESILFCLISLPLAIDFVKIGQPFLVEMLEKKMTFDFIFQWRPIIAILGILLITGILSGAYISFYLTRMQPLDLLQKRMFHGNRKINIRSLLIVFQFIIFIVLLITTIFINKQIKYSIEANSNLSKRNIIVVQLNNDQIRKKYPVLKQNIKSIPEILNISGTGFYFPPHNNTMLIQIPNPENKKEMIVLDGVWVDYDISNLLDIEMIEGRKFQNEKDLGKMLVNECFVRDFKLKHPIGQQIGFGTIIGVVKDFPLHSMHKKIIPASILVAEQNKMYQLIVEVNPKNTTNVVKEIRKKYLELCPDGIFEYKLYQDQIKEMYNTEFRHANLLSSFSILSIFISIIGLFGFTGYMIIQRTKEIGIRKVNGASTLGIMLLLSGNFIKWILVSFVISCPIAYYVTTKWLENFAYKTELSWWVFAVAGLVAVAVALITVSWQSYRAANRNPVEALRYE